MSYLEHILEQNWLGHLNIPILEKHVGIYLKMQTLRKTNETKKTPPNPTENQRPETTENTAVRATLNRYWLLGEVPLF